MRWACLLLIVPVALGCGRAEYKSAPKATRPVAEHRLFESAAAVVDRSESTAAAEGEKPLPGADALQRKIIYTAEVQLIVEKFNSIPAEVEALAKRFAGYVAGSTVTGLPGRPRSGQWTIRVPVDRYEEFLAAVQKLGEVHRVSTDSKDVSEEYYDLESRIRNKKREETRLLELLADATGKLEEVLSVERELARVREEIERMEGRVRVLDNLTALTMVKLTVNEIKDYVPEQAPTYTTRVRRAWSGSIDTLVSTAKTVSIAVVVAAPWLGVLLVPVILLVLLLRFRRKRRG
jgi:hypothetical protein